MPSARVELATLGREAAAAAPAFVCAEPLRTVAGAPLETAPAAWAFDST
jgi:hypothetical protein